MRSGLQGAAALALSLSVTGRGGELALVGAVVHGVVLLSILIEGGTIGPMTRWLLGRQGGGLPGAKSGVR